MKRLTDCARHIFLLSSFILLFGVFVVFGFNSHFQTTGRGLANVRLILSGGNLGETRYAQTNAFGYYRFSGVSVGFDYVLTPAAKRYNFAPVNQTFTLSGERTNADFVAAP